MRGATASRARLSKPSFEGLGALEGAPKGAFHEGRWRMSMATAGGDGSFSNLLARRQRSSPGADASRRLEPTRAAAARRAPLPPPPCERGGGFEP